MSTIHTILEKVGLSPNETKVYIAGLTLGSSLANAIAKKAGLKRSLCYHLLNSLLEKGLANKSGKSYSHHYTMEPPERLKDFIKRKQLELKRTESQIDEISAELESMYAPKLRPASVRFYEDAEGLKSAALESLQSKEKIIRGLISPEIFAIFDEKYIRFWADERATKDIQTKMIWTEHEKPSYLKDLAELRLAPLDLDFTNTIIIHDDKVTVFSGGKEFFAFIVENKNYAKTMKNFFDFVWEKSIKNK